MKTRRHSNFYNFIGDSETGLTFRWGRTLEDNPSFAPWPELADISISNHCTKDCSYCYRDSKDNKSFLSINDYDYILKSLEHPYWGNVFQIAIGGGEPLEHPDFLNIIDLTNKYKIVPNFTTNGLLLNERTISYLEEKVGAIAISLVDIVHINNVGVKLLLESKIKTNVHFILSDQTINQAVDILKGKYNEVLSNVNGIIFLTYKPTGRASTDQCLKQDSRFMEFINLIDKNNCQSRIGFDACFVPALLHYTNTHAKFVDSCECAYFSVYIDEKLNVKPCSFANDKLHSFNLKEYSFEKIWEEKFKAIRDYKTNSCVKDCKNKNDCRGACPYFEQINFCYSDIKEV